MHTHYYTYIYFYSSIHSTHTVEIQFMHTKYTPHALYLHTSLLHLDSSSSSSMSRSTWSFDRRNIDPGMTLCQYSLEHSSWWFRCLGQTLHWWKPREFHCIPTVCTPPGFMHRRVCTYFVLNQTTKAMYSFIYIHLDTWCY